MSRVDVLVHGFGEPPLWGDDDMQPWQFQPEAYGAVGDGKIASDVATNGTNTFTSSTISTQGVVGQWVMINGGRGTADTAAVGQITGISGTSVTISTTATSLPINATASSLNAVFGTNDRTAINACVTAAKSYALSHSYAAEVMFSDKCYVVAGNTQTSDGNVSYNCQIPVPYPDADLNNKRKLVIGFRGAVNADHIVYWEATVPQLAGTSIVAMQTAPSTIDGTFGPQSVFGAPTPEAGIAGLDTGDPSFINHKPVFTNIQVITPVFTNLTSFDFSYSCGVRVDGCSAMAFAGSVEGNGVKLLSQWTNLNQQGVGLRLPIGGNNADTYVGNFASEGNTIGMIAPCEHTFVDVYKAMYSNVALMVGSSTTGHGLTIGHVTAEAYLTGIKYQGGSGNVCPIHIQSWTTELNNTWDVDDSGNQLYGEVHWYSTFDGLSAVPAVNGGANLRVYNAQRPPGAVTAPSLPATTVAQKNTFYRDAAVTVTGGTVTAIAVDGAATGLTSGTVFVPTGKNITLTYSSAPTWHWTLL